MMKFLNNLSSCLVMIFLVTTYRYNNVNCDTFTNIINEITTEFSDILQFVLKTTSEGNGIWKIAATKIIQAINSHNKADEMNIILNTLEEYTKKLQQLVQDTSQVTVDEIHLLGSNIDQAFNRQIQLNNLSDNIAIINQRFTRFLAYQDNTQINNTESFSFDKTGFEEFTLVDFSKSAVSYDSNSIWKTLENIYEAIAPQPDPINFAKKSIFYLVKEKMETNWRSRCTITQSPQQLINNFALYLRVTQMKAYMMMQFSYVILKLHGKGNFTKERELIRKSFVDNLDKQTEILNEVLSMTDNSYWRCDPSNHELDVTYTEITRLVQGYIENQADMDGKASCLGGCEIHSNTQVRSCTKGTLCTQQPRCNGNLIDCKYADTEMWICKADSSSVRRYDWVFYQNSGLHGLQKHCPNMIHAGSWKKLLFVRCFYCFCLCEEESDLSDRYFSLRETTSDIENNKVVIGVRFVKRNQIIHLQIKQGILEANGTINNQDQSWVNVPNFTKGDALENEDYFKLRWNSRTIDLDDVETKKNFTVTGVRLRKLGAHINLEIQATSFNFSAGRLIPELSHWIGSDKTELDELNPRTEMKLLSQNLPIHSVNSNMDSNPNQYLKFTHSDEWSDMAQSTVPFIDIQTVEPHPAVPIDAIGIFHKSPKDTAGFIAPKVHTIDLSRYL